MTCASRAPFPQVSDTRTARAALCSLRAAIKVAIIADVGAADVRSSILRILGWARSGSTAAAVSQLALHLRTMRAGSSRPFPVWPSQNSVASLPPLAVWCRDALGPWKLGLYALVIAHVGLRLFMYWSVSLAAKLQFSAEGQLDRASDVLVVPKEFSGHPEIVPLQRRRLVRARHSRCCHVHVDCSGLRPPRLIVCQDLP